MKSQAIRQTETGIIPVSEFNRAMALRNGPRVAIAPTQGNLALKTNLVEPKSNDRTPDIQYNTHDTTSPTMGVAQERSIPQPESTPPAEEKDSANGLKTDSSEPPPQSDSEPVKRKSEEASAQPTDHSQWWCAGGFLLSIGAGVLTYLSQLPDQVKQSLYFMVTAIGIVCGLTGIGKAVMPSSNGNNNHVLATTLDDNSQMNF